ncbi:hypothetical protein Tco_1464632, partial [Tanacetum coccineum]
MVPMVDIARMLAQQGATITIITTPLIANRFRPVISRAIEAKLQIQILELELRLTKVGLPEGCESFDTLPSSDSIYKLFAAIDLLEEPAEELLKGLCPQPGCIISDFLIPWTTDNILEWIESDTERFVLPGLPDRVEVTKLQIIGTSKEASSYQKGFLFRAIQADKAAYGIVVHTFNELEPEYVKEFSKVRDTKVWCIGPVSLLNKDIGDISERGNKTAINNHDCLKWLNEREPGSV